MLVICAISIAVMAGGHKEVTFAQVEGKVLSIKKHHYVADFSRDMSTFKLADNSTDFSKYLVNKNVCQKERK